MDYHNQGQTQDFMLNSKIGYEGQLRDIFYQQMLKFKVFKPSKVCQHLAFKLKSQNLIKVKVKCLYLYWINQSGN